MKKYDYLIVGSGLFGATFAHQATLKGKKCLVIDKRSHIGGNVYCDEELGIQIHTYGAHIFHTSNKEVWDYINQFAEFNNFILNLVANYKGTVYNLPFNMNTFSKIWPDVVYPKDAIRHIEEEKKEIIDEPKNLEEKAISLVGRSIYERLIKNYTEKQWNRSCKNLPEFIITRIPVRLTYNNNYYYDKYQGIPIGGYNQIIEKMLEGSNVELNVNYLENKDKYSNIANKIIYTGMIDEFYNYQFGELEYRSLEFEHITLPDIDNYQGTACMSFTDENTKYTRIIEHKHFEMLESKGTIITKEYPKDWKKGDEAYYPLNDDKNNNLYKKYKEISEKDTNIIFGGRLGHYKYYDMDKTIEAALKLSKEELN